MVDQKTAVMVMDSRSGVEARALFGSERFFGAEDWSALGSNVISNGETFVPDFPFHLEKLRRLRCPFTEGSPPLATTHVVFLKLSHDGFNQDNLHPPRFPRTFKWRAEYFILFAGTTPLVPPGYRLADFLLVADLHRSMETRVLKASPTHGYFRKYHVGKCNDQGQLAYVGYHPNARHDNDRVMIQTGPGAGRIDWMHGVNEKNVGHYIQLVG